MADGAPAPGPGGGFDVDKLKAQLGKSGMIIAGAGVAGLIACMLPWYSSSGSSAFTGTVSNSYNAFWDWRGEFAFFCEVAAAALGVLVILKMAGKNEKVFCQAAMGGAGLAALLTLWFILKWSGTGASVDEKFIKVSSGISIGPFINLAACAGIAFGGFLVTKEKGHLGK